MNKANRSSAHDRGDRAGMRFLLRDERNTKFIQRDET
jgi:hypothetical protein